MANKEVQFKITVDANGATKATKEVSEGFDGVATQAEKAAKKTKEAQKSSKEAAQGITSLANALKMTPLGGFVSGVQSSVTALKGMTASSKALRISLLALPFVAIAAAIMAVFKAFSSTQESADRLNAIMQPLKATLAVLWGQFQQLSITIVDAFTNPQQAVKDLWEAIKQNIVNRFTGVIKLISTGFETIQNGAKGAVLAIEGIFNKEKREQSKEYFRLAKQGLIDVAEAAIQVTTGVEDAFEKIATAIDNVTDKIDEGVQAGRRLAEIEKEIAVLRIEQAVPLARMRREMEEQRNIARDTSLSEEERLAAAQKAIELRKQIRDEELRLLDLQIEQLELQQTLNNTSDEEKLKLQELIAQRETLAANAERETGRLIGQQATLIQQIEKRGEEEEKANIAYLTGLEQRGEAFRRLLLTEEQLLQQAVDSQLDQINYLVEREILTLEEAEQIKDEIRRRAFENEIEERIIHADSILALENEIRDKEQLFREAATQAQRDALSEEIEILRERLAERKRTTAEILKDEQAKQNLIRGEINRTLGTAIAAGIAQAKSAKEFGKEVIRTIAKQAGAAAAASVYKSVPFPANLFLAPIAGAAAERLISSFAGFARGGVVGGGMAVNRANGDDQFITAKTGEVVLTQQQQQALGGAPALARAGVPGFSGSVSLDASGFNEAVGRIPENINVIVDISEVQRKLEDKDRNINRTSSFID
jgi:hypothetical protein